MSDSGTGMTIINLDEGWNQEIKAKAIDTLENYLEKGYYKECCDVCQKVVDSVENLGTQVMPDVYIPILSAYLKATEDKKNIGELIDRVCERDPAMKAELSKNF